MYSTKADILSQIPETTLVQLTDDNNLGVVDEAVVTRAIADADEEIDGYCGSRYTVPFSTVPAIVRKISVDIAIYNLYARRMGASDDRKDRYNAAIRLLKDISKGAVALGVSAPAPVSTSDESSFSGNTRIFTRDKMRGY